MPPNVISEETVHLYWNNPRWKHGISFVVTYSKMLYLQKRNCESCGMVALRVWTCWGPVPVLTQSTVVPAVPSSWAHGLASPCCSRAVVQWGRPDPTEVPGCITHSSHTALSSSPSQYSMLALNLTWTPLQMMDGRERKGAGAFCVSSCSMT